MATSKGHHITKPNYRFLPIKTEYSLSDPTFEFDESDLFNTNSARANSPEFVLNPVVNPSRLSKNSKPSSSSSGFSGGRPASVPVNVPDWSKILGNEYRGSRRKDKFEEGDDDDDVSDDGERGRRVPPHEFLARTRMASLSVHEGVGRTLKGRDLSRVRNAIWAKTGFQD
ncbi:hypothetical protein RIF29_27662 [Crotalaria pallida]|uniref:Senescence regulator S40 n=1 Tax=Crotalaria pallida TaxID=3830 RepID=A0AAN9HYY8_CROPI